MSVPSTVAECDKELREYRKALRLTSRDGRIAVWEQIDRVLEIRLKLQKPRKSVA